ncbi:dihydrofolate reductase family protein [Paenibacillus mendelii]|uniref:Dihydrofolate reductase family protein n=1 Tax=Paenibacillus mendelii TaxID=206163 RepID=A0ABV6J2Q1_9BACL|nr:dihydrofolate reductase family protein [Paenibacillus mendelii]MCQ6560506.1 dihydrofolate reductase family protein [Paenibacillus mendelii]
MRKIKMLNRVSIDGYFASNNEANFGMDWFIHDPEVDKASHVIGGKMDALLLGGTTYRGFERSWVPFLNDPLAPEHLKKVAEELTDMTKVVFSKTIKQSNWANTQIYDSGLIEVVRQLKQHSSSDILVLGSGSIVQQLANERLIDEYIFIVTPVVAGEGKPLFPHVKPFNLTLGEAKTFESGNVVLHYVLKK